MTTNDEDIHSSSTLGALHASTKGIYQALVDVVDTAGDWTHRQVVGKQDRPAAWRDYRPRPPAHALPLCGCARRPPAHELPISRTPSFPGDLNSRAHSPLPGELAGPPAKAMMVDHYQNLAVRLAEAQPAASTGQTPADTDGSATAAR